MSENPRSQALKLLQKTFTKNGYSNIVLDSGLSGSSMDSREKSFCAALYYGVIERRITLDYIISGYSKQNISRMQPEVMNILRMGIYQLKYMDSVPDSAAVNESVKLAKKVRHSSCSGFVNAVLRSFLRDEKEIKYPKSAVKRLSVEYSVPEQLAKHFIDSYGKEKAEGFLKSSLGKPPTAIRLNSTKGTTEEILKEIADLEPKETICPGCYTINTGNITGHKAFLKGLFHVQDMSSQLCCAALAPKEGETVGDVCAAPGGKSFTISELMNGTGRVLSYDIHSHRAELIAKGAKRLGLENVHAGVANAAAYNPELEKADRILCDVPCSGLGVIRRKPEIKYKELSDFKELPDLQYRILSAAAAALKKGGEIIYSTCTLNPAENEQVVERFLREHSEFEGTDFLTELGEPFGESMATIFPGYFDSDGFFIAKLRRRE